MLLVAASALGARHALDADHLSVIDGIARQNLERNPVVARLGGALFSAGHILVASIVAVLGSKYLFKANLVPSWLEAAGLTASGIILTLLGVLNLRTAFVQSHGSVSVVGFRSRFLNIRYGWISSTLIGAVFAISFDTIAIALGLSFAGEHLGGPSIAILGLLCFAAGMIAIGSINSWIIVRLVSAGSARSERLFACFSGAVGGANILLGTLALSRLSGTDLAAVAKLDGLVLSALVMTPVLAFALGIALRARQQAAESHVAA